MEGTATSREWVEGSEWHGARLITPGRGWTAGAIGFDRPKITCNACSPDGAISGFVSFGLPQEVGTGDHSDTAVEAAGLADTDRAQVGLHPAFFAAALVVSRSDHIVPLEIEAVTEVTALRVAGLSAHTRIFVRPESPQDHASGIVVDSGCLTLFGIFAHEDGRRLSSRDLEFLDSAITVERYRPAPRALPEPRVSPAARRSLAEWRLRIEDVRQAFGLDPLVQVPR